MTFTTRKLREDKPSFSKKMIKAAPAVLRTGAVASGLFGLWHKKQERDQAEKRRSSFLKKIIIVLVALLGAAVLFAGTIKALVALRIINSGTFYSVAGTDLPTDDDGFINILLLGSGDKGHDGVDLTDTIMVASLDPDTGATVLFSIPRDLYITDSDKMGTGRINELYRNYKNYLRRTKDMEEADASKESMNELARELGNKLGLPLHRVIKVDFIAFVDVVDALGGVDVDVKQDIVDREYPGPNYSYQTFEILAGPQHLDGETALKYARSRHTTSDFDRAARQQQLVQALSKKAQELGIVSSPGKIMSLLKIITEHTETTMTVSEMIGLGGLAEDLERDRVISMQLNDRSGTSVLPGGFLYSPPREQFGGAAVLLPLASSRADGGSWGQIRTAMHMLTHNRMAYLNPVRIHILNAGAKNGLARSLANELDRYGFPVQETGNATADGLAPKDDDKREASSVVPSLPEDTEEAEFFATLLGMDVADPPTTLPPEILGQVTILLGSTYEFTPIDALVAVPELTTPATDSGALAPTP